MERPERRKHPRVQIYDPISYVGIGSQGIHVGQNIGVARDVSVSGIKIESICDIKAKKIVLNFVDIERDFSEIPGKVIYSRKNKAGNFEIGIHLQGKHKENIEFTKKLVRHYHYSKQSSCLVAASPNLH
jgi:hypothetical protein